MVSLNFATDFRATWIIQTKNKNKKKRVHQQLCNQSVNPTWKKSLPTHIEKQAGVLAQPLEKKAQHFLRLHMTVRAKWQKENYSASRYQFDYRTYV